MDQQKINQIQDLIEDFIHDNVETMGGCDDCYDQIELDIMIEDDSLKDLIGELKKLLHPTNLKELIEYVKKYS